MPDSFKLVYDTYTSTSFHEDGERYTVFRVQENLKKCGCNPTGFRQCEEERIEDKGVKISDINIFCNSTGIKKQAVGWATIGFKAYQGSFLWKEDPTLRKA